MISKRPPLLLFLIGYLLPISLVVATGDRFAGQVDERNRVFQFMLPSAECRGIPGYLLAGYASLPRIAA